LKKNIGIVGGGFRGILAAAMMRREGHKVTLIESGNFIGGILRPILWEKFALDIGIQLFDNFDRELESILREICGDNLEQIEINYASYFQGKTTEEFAILDLSTEAKDAVAQNLYEIVIAASKNSQEIPNSLGERNRQTFGERAGAIVNSATEKMLLISPDRVEPEYLSATPYNRIRILPDDVACILKQAPELDNTIAMSRNSLVGNETLNFYPRNGGMSSFCDSALTYCRKNGIRLITNAAIKSIKQNDSKIRLLIGKTPASFDTLIWTSGFRDLSPLLLNKKMPAKLEHAVPMVIYYFCVHKKNSGPYTYVQNHDSSIDVFRCATQGAYSNQINDRGETFVCAETTTPIGHPRWENPEKFSSLVWEQCAAMKAVSGSPIKSFSVKIPATYRAPLLGYRETETDIIEAAKNLPGLILLNHRAFTRSAIFTSIEQAIS